MTKWNHLVEGDASYRDLERNAGRNNESYQAYIGAWLRQGAPVTDSGWRTSQRIIEDFNTLKAAADKLPNNILNVIRYSYPHNTISYFRAIPTANFNIYVSYRDVDSYYEYTVHVGYPTAASILRLAQNMVNEDPNSAAFAKDRLRIQGIFEYLDNHYRVRDSVAYRAMTTINTLLKNVSGDRVQHDVEYF